MPAEGVDGRKLRSGGYADAFTGSLKALNTQGCGGRALNDAWADGPRTYLGLAVAGFTITGPQSPSVLANMPVAIEQHVEWIADCIAYVPSTG